MPGYANFVGGSKHKIIDRRVHPERHAQKKYIAARRFPYFTQREKGLEKKDVAFSFGWAPVNKSTETDAQKKRTLWQEGSSKRPAHGQMQDKVELTAKNSMVTEALDSDPVNSFDKNRRRLLAETDWIGAEMMDRVVTPFRAPICGLALGYGDPSSPSSNAPQPHDSSSVARDSSPPTSNSKQLPPYRFVEPRSKSRTTSSAQQAEEERQHWKLDDQSAMSEDVSREHSLLHPQSQSQQGPIPIMQGTPLDSSYQTDSLNENDLNLDQLSASSHSFTAGQYLLNTFHNDSFYAPYSRSSSSVKPDIVRYESLLPNPFRALSILTGLPDISGDAP
ncbi:hypothetical protein [Phaffia rhodozyma]|uniref:Uncharacterized protein n=1 Tax=Phaffia rhodozyma TaxID=264483 RepID=A0A0F7SFY5_PHARH|nr:hypothetical protein [Phaffia rhodozyma]